MLVEVKISVIDALEALHILVEEYNKRIKFNDGNIEGLARVIEALEDADRIVIEHE